LIMLDERFRNCPGPSSAGKHDQIEPFTHFVS
jgi:hypothetical protein